VLCSIQTPGKARGASESDLNLGRLQRDFEEGTPLHRSRHWSHATALLHVLTGVAHAAVETRLCLSELQTGSSCGRRHSATEGPPPQICEEQTASKLVLVMKSRSQTGNAMSLQQRNRRDVELHRFEAAEDVKEMQYLRSSVCAVCAG